MPFYLPSRPLRKLIGGENEKKKVKVKNNHVQGHIELKLNVLGLVAMNIVGATNLKKTDALGKTDP